MKNLFIGLMSGTSVDSIDSALVNIDKGSLKILETNSSSINKNLKKRIFEAVNADDLSAPVSYTHLTLPTICSV